MTVDDATKEILRLQAEVLRASAEAIVALVERDGQVTRWFGISEYAELTGLSESTVRRRILAGDLEGAKQIGGRWAIPVKEAS